MSDVSEPPPEPEKPRRLSFREANLGPEHKPEPPGQPPAFFNKRKRALIVGLLAVGTTGAVAYGLGHRNPECDQTNPNRPASCTHSGGGGGHGYGFFSGSSSSDASSVSRGGFGATGSAHASGGE